MPDQEDAGTQAQAEKDQRTGAYPLSCQAVWLACVSTKAHRESNRAPVAFAQKAVHGAGHDF